METFFVATYFACLLGVPVAGYLLAARHTRASLIHMLGGATLGGAAFGALVGSLSLLTIGSLGVTLPRDWQLWLALYFVVTSGRTDTGSRALAGR